MSDETPVPDTLWWHKSGGLMIEFDGAFYLASIEPYDMPIARGSADAVRLVAEAASETEWGWCPDPDEPGMVLAAVDEAAARERVKAARIRVLMRRTVAIGPWTVVES